MFGIDSLRDRVRFDIDNSRLCPVFGITSLRDSVRFDIDSLRLCPVFGIDSLDIGISWALIAPEIVSGLTLIVE